MCGVLYNPLPIIEPDFKRYQLYIMMIIFAFKKAELREKTQDANFSLPRGGGISDTFA